jgi:hypothetical protein
VTTDGVLRARIGALTDHQAERALQTTMERLVDRVGELAVGDEDSARELVAAFLGQSGSAVAPDSVVRPSISLDTHVRSTLALLAYDPATAGDVRAALDELPDETQMFADPITAAVVLGALVAFLQTKMHASVARKDGRLEFAFSMSKQATSDETVAKVVDAVRAVSIG